MKKVWITISLALLFNIISSQNCIDPSLIDPDAVCITLYAPVCGCDGNTYSNTCVAQTQAGVTSWTQGECSTSSNNCLSVHQVNGDIPSGFYESIQSTQSDGTVLSGSSVLFESESEVLLDDNFEVELNAEFTAEIDDCNEAGFCIGSCNFGNSIAESFNMPNGGTFEFWYQPGASLCPSTAVEIDIQVNGNSVYSVIVDMMDENFIPFPPFLVFLEAPPNATIDISANLVPTTIVQNQAIFCLILGDATFAYSY